MPKEKENPKPNQRQDRHLEWDGMPTFSIWSDTRVFIISGLYNLSVYNNTFYGSPDAQTPLDMLGVEDNAEGERENPRRQDQQLE